jgi:hypothetical protein
MAFAKKDASIGRDGELNWFEKICGENRFVKAIVVGISAENSKGEAKRGNDGERTGHQLLCLQSVVENLDPAHFAQ